MPVDGNAKEGSFVQFAVFKLDSKWHVLGLDERRKGVAAFLDSLDGRHVHTHIYLLSGLKASSDILLWKIAKNTEDLQDSHIAMKRTVFGSHLSDVAIYTGVTKPSTYTKTESELEFLASAEKRKKYISFYPFTKTVEWYLLAYEKRRKIMSDHIAIGKKFPEVSQVLLYSFGADDQEFVVAYEMDDMKQYIDCVMALRESESRLYTKADTPVFTGVRKKPEELLSLFGGINE